MHIQSLSLDNYRNYEQLHVQFTRGVVTLEGSNGQGKTNLLEAMYLLATTKSGRARSDADLVRWSARSPLNPLPFARIVARVQRAHDSAHLDVVVRPPTQNAATDDDDAPEASLLTDNGGTRKRFKVNGVVRKASETLGIVNAVYFAPTDVDLVAGAPACRRRYLDIMLCQIRQSYVRALQTYNRVLLQRNYLLRQIRDQRQPAATLDYWNEMLIEYGGYIMTQRMAAAAHLAVRSTEVYAQLSGHGHLLRVTYHPTLGVTEAVSSLPDTAHDIRTALQAHLNKLREREIMQGVSLVGPHRDDLAFAVDGIDMTAFGSRGQQRSVALALKIAELDYIRQQVGESPILLLDDATSELDPRRRAAVLALVEQEEQAFLTSADTLHFSGDALRSTQRWFVSDGCLSTVAASDSLNGLHNVLPVEQGALAALVEELA